MTDQIISEEGYEKLKQELEYLTTTKRREIADRIQTAKDLGDLSENAEYSDAKDALAFNDGRIGEIEAILKNATVVASKHHKEKIGMGSVITVKVGDKTKDFTIVSFNEVDPMAGKISNESPLGKSFLNKKKGEIVKVSTPKGEVEYKVIDIN